MVAVEKTASAYAYRLLIKHLLHTPLVHATAQEIVYRDLNQQSYRNLARAHRPARERARQAGR
jgi:fatty-acyl-CoA synthase